MKMETKLPQMENRPFSLAEIPIGSFFIAELGLRKGAIGYRTYLRTAEGAMYFSGEPRALVTRSISFGSDKKWRLLPEGTVLTITIGKG